ncbi:amidohydrolase [Rhodococcus spelaei]|uniref:Amidohydrolase n=1 Tax=Rhodococcus spelaei TaxID=2546320 RepID=A0A541B9W7_9NOCA|nr:M20 family metallopeptidase [Rhodococcus spelaei]TQF69126.1 amidohydrolase [Rhodococcus spelaei]
MSIRDDARDLHGDLVQLRRALHAEPEVGLHLPRTQEKVLVALDGLPLQLSTGSALSSVIGVLRGGKPGPTVLLRGDMDALPVAERTGLDYTSRNPDRMHACGHDLHTSMLVGAAKLLSAHRDQLAGDVVFMFQPGEEGYDGARLMIEEGMFDASGSRPIAAYGLHVSASGLPSGVFTTRRGPVLAASDAVQVTVRGRGGHGSAPHRALDPIPAACEMVTALQTFVTRSFDPFDPVMLTVGAFQAGTANNVIPDEARFDATVRSFSAESHARVRDGFARVCAGIAAAHGLEVDVDYVDQYPVTVNNDVEAEFAADVVGEVHGEERFVWTPQPATGSEDFSRVLDEIPGAFVFLGARPGDKDPATAAYNHSPLAEFDDGVLGDGAALYSELALRRLAQSRPAA